MKILLHWEKTVTQVKSIQSLWVVTAMHLVITPFLWERVVSQEAQTVLLWVVNPVQTVITQLPSVQDLSQIQTIPFRWVTVQHNAKLPIWLPVKYQRPVLMPLTVHNFIRSVNQSRTDSGVVLP